MKTTSIDGLRRIQIREGTVLKGYHDSHGYLTIGTGHLVRPGEPYFYGVPITQDKATALLHDDLKRTENAVNAYICPSINQFQFDALVSLTFNIGTNGLHGSHLRMAINQNMPIVTIKIYWLAWDHAGGVLDPDLLLRRTKEFNQYCTLPKTI